MRFSITTWLKKLHIKFLNWRAGNGFTVPDPEPFQRLMYKYCHLIVNDEEFDKIQCYEDEITKLIEKFPEATREIAAKEYIEALEWVFGKERFN